MTKSFIILPKHKFFSLLKTRSCICIKMTEYITDRRAIMQGRCGSVRGLCLAKLSLPVQLQLFFSIKSTITYYLLLLLYITSEKYSLHESISNFSQKKLLCHHAHSLVIRISGNVLN